MNKFILILIILLTCYDCKSEIDNKVNTNIIEENIIEDPIEKIKQFYLTFYGVENPQEDKNTMKKYVSERILNKIDSLSSDGENLILDYNPFIKGQDYFSDEIKKTLKVVPLKNENEYRVSFLQFGYKGEELTNVDLLLKKDTKGKYLIHSILNDDFLNFRVEDSKSKDISQVFKENLSTPNEVIDYLIFTKDKRDSLQINTEILDYISKNTTRKNSTYLFALENYAQKSREDLGWNYEEFAKIKGFIFNTTYPLRKKYWNDKFVEWYNGKPEKLLGAGSFWLENNYYGLPKLEEYVDDFRSTYWGEDNPL